jgi:hypothetical protein
MGTVRTIAADGIRENNVAVMGTIVEIIDAWISATNAANDETDTSIH